MNAISRIHIILRSSRRAIAILGWLSVFANNRAAAQEKLTLKPTPKTVTWGYYDAKAAPVLRT